MSDELDQQPRGSGDIEDRTVAGDQAAPGRSNDQPTGMIELTSKPAVGTQPAHVSLFIDGDRRFTVRTSDLENIGSQLRGKTKFSFFNTILPIIITLLTVAGTTLIGQLFQYVSWRNSTALQIATLHAQRALTAYEKASTAIDRRYHETNLFLAATRDLGHGKGDPDNKIYKMAVDLNQQRFNAFYAQLKSWHENYDATLAAIDYSLDRPVGLQERYSIRYFVDENGARKLDCTQMLTGQLRRLGLEVNSLKLQFAALNYCFAQSIKGFDDGEEDAVIDNAELISDTVKKTTSELNDDVHSMSNEFRCFAKRRIEYLEGRKQGTIFRLPTYLYGWFRTPPDPVARHFAASLKECDFSPPVKS